MRPPSTAEDTWRGASKSPERFNTEPKAYDTFMSQHEISFACIIRVPPSFDKKKKPSYAIFRYADRVLLFCPAIGKKIS